MSTTKSICTILMIAIAANAPFAGSANAATVVSFDPIAGVTGATATVEGTSFDFPGAGRYSSVVSSGTDRIATIANPPTVNDFFFQNGSLSLDSSVYRYAQVYYSLSAPFSGSTHQLRLQTTDQAAAFVNFNNAASIPSSAGAHSFVIDLQDDTNLATLGYSGNLTLFRWDFWNNSGNNGKAFTLDRVVFAPSIRAEPTGTIVLFDHFNTTGDANSDLSTRQTGSLATKTYSATNSIANGRLSVGGPKIRNNADFTVPLTDPAIDQFTLSFDAAYTGGTQWISPYLNTHTNRADSTLGVLIWNTGNVGAYFDNGGMQGTTTLSNADLTTALGSWDVSAMNNFTFLATPTSASAGTYDLFINGVEVLSNLAYSFDLIGELYWEHIAPGGIGGTNTGLYDNLLVSTSVIIPEPNSLLLLGLAGLGIVFIAGRRHARFRNKN